MILPTFFVIGAGKSGTTALHAYLGLHPEIEMTRRKEVHLLLGPDWRRRVQGYDREYRGGTPERGDASPGYTVFPRHADTPERMRELVPDARLIYLVRDPVERALAQYAQHTITRTESRPIAAALDPDDPANDYLCISAYAAQVENYLRVFPSDRLLVVDQRDLLTERRRTLREVFSFLEVEPGFWTDDFAELHNARGADNVLLPSPIERLGRRGVGRLLPRGTRSRLAGFARRRLGQTVAPVLPPELRRRIEGRLAPDAARLRELTGLELAHWSV